MLRIKVRKFKIVRCNLNLPQMSGIYLYTHNRNRFMFTFEKERKDNDFFFNKKVVVAFHC